MSGTISHSHYADRTAAKREVKQATQVKVSYMTKAGKPSKMAADWRYFDTAEEAKVYCDGMNSRAGRNAYAIVG